ncbi:MAG: class I SAM-dependent methyltransferase [Firmicutes bacterium]|nr:class I SAM-dependent methyltransferase [Bacillota bacterium]
MIVKLVREFETLEGGNRLSEQDLTRWAGTFDRVARYFDIIRPLFIDPYRQAAKYTLGHIKSAGSSPALLDIGTGTGTLAGVFAAQGAKVTGVDISRGMLDQARKKYGSQIDLVQAAAHNPGPFTDDSFDIVSAAFVLHEMSADYRILVLEEMKGLAGKKVLVIDYIPNINPISHLLSIWRRAIIAGS